MGADRLILHSAMMTITQEQSANNKPYGHGTSVGAFQLINIHGSHTQRMNLNFSANWYYRQALTKPRSWTPGQIAQSVQRSGHPYAYNQWYTEANRTLKIFMGKCRLR